MAGSNARTTKPPVGSDLPIDRTSTRALFSELLAWAMGEVERRPSPLAVAYLVELLEGRLRAPEPLDSELETSMAETLLSARFEEGALRVARLRALGDRALFVSGFFGESLDSGLVDASYYSDVGRAAYANVSSCLALRVGQETWSSLFRELAEGFPGFVDILSEVGGRSRPGRPVDLLRIYDRFLRSGDDRDRRQLVRRGLVPPPPSARRLLQ